MEGPTILAQRESTSGHFYTEFEFTVIAANPEPITPPAPVYASIPFLV